MKPRSRHEAGEMEDDGGAWMNDCEGPKMAEFLFWLKSEPKAEAPLNNIIMISSPSTGGLEKNTLRLVSMQFKDDAEEGTKSIKWKGPGNNEEYRVLPKPNNLMGIIFNGSRKRRHPNLKSIHCQGLDTLMDLNGCPSGLEALHCGGCKLIKSVAPLAACTNLCKLYLVSSKVSSLQPLMGCLKLEYLGIHDIPVSDFRPMSACINLKVLWMGVTQVSDLGPLSSLHQLGLIDVRQTKVTDLSPLSSLPHLETLLCSNTKISDLNPLSKCSELKALDIRKTEVKSLTPLLQCKKLKYLNHGKLNEDAKISEGYVQYHKEICPDLKVTELDFLAWWDTVSEDLKHKWSWCRY